MAEPAQPAAAYVLSTHANRSFLADLEIDPSVDIAAIYRGRASLPGGMTARWMRGAKVPTRIVATTHAFPLLIHESVAEALTNARIGGWHASAVDLLSAQGKPLRDYHFLCVRGRCGPLTATPSGRMQFDLQGWDGSDLFVSEGATTLLVTPQAQRLIDGFRERHVRLAPVRLAQTESSLVR